MKDEKLLPDELIQCEVCLKEVPSSESQSAETEDYVAHFCGLECYQQWHKKKQEGKEED